MEPAAWDHHADEWAALLSRAERDDALARVHHPHYPAIMGPLVRAAAGSSLARFPPYISMFLLRFDGPLCNNLPPPVSIGVAAGPARYLVWWGQVFSHLERATIVQETTDPHEAVALAELLLRNWPFPYELRRPPAGPRPA
ncbi:hypothetical protein Q2K19_19025 [Micromonospora soli]|uniref:hypothetical protein n=1 Tax=Micromonospora sp. NBRC 110009 TaxID=3061627 RepID=UPI002673563A|nr:hypothetical protein [Micromonospora sp. NBRC 110009]WKT96316.1 hypothetical protein Q2K19_19025 [Micromonospora sp. NBRC 110009]